MPSLLGGLLAKPPPGLLLATNGWFSHKRGFTPLWGQKTCFDKTALNHYMRKGNDENGCFTSNGK